MVRLIVIALFLFVSCKAHYGVKQKKSFLKRSQYEFHR